MSENTAKRSCFWQPESLSPFDERCRVIFTGKPIPAGGQNFSSQERQRYRQQLCQEAAFTAEALCSASQVHGDTMSMARPGKLLPETDAIILTQSELPVLIQVADCVPIALYAPDVHVGAVVHAGWRGTALSILPKTIRELQSKYRAELSQMRLVLGPSISRSYYEVGEEVVEALLKTVASETPVQAFAEQRVNGKWQADVKAVNVLQAKALGLHDANIESIELCTYAETEQFWSYRRGDWQRQAVLMQLMS